MAQSLADQLEERIADRRATVAVLGLGYVGLPMAVHIAQSGFDVVGVDVDERKLEQLRTGRSYIGDVPPDALYALVAAGKLRVTSDYGALRDVEIVLICVPTPLGKSKDPDLRYIVAATESLSKHLRAGQLIVLESTGYPGSTEEVVRPQLETSGLVAGEDFYLAFSPERIDPGNRKYGLENTPKIVGGLTATCRELAAAFYRTFISNVYPVSSVRVAEMAKLLENTFRAVNIALANEIALLCRHLQIDVWEVIEAAATKPFGFMPFYPGPGLGGHCIPIDPHYLAWKAKTHELPTRFIDLASEINNEMPRHVVIRVADALNSIGRPIRDSRILVLGVAYKPNVSDTRESPALKIMSMLRERGALLSYHDPHVAEIDLDGERYTSKPLTPKLLETSDCVLITTHHDAVDYELVGAHSPLTVDTRNILRDVECRNPVFGL